MKQHNWLQLFCLCFMLQFVTLIGCNADSTQRTSQEATPVTFTVMSYNLYGWNALVKNAWKSDNMVGLIEGVQPDFLGAQECEGRSDSIKNRLSGPYEIAGGELHGHAIFYRSDRWNMEEEGHFNLNEMDKWGQRVVRWAKFSHIKTQKGLYMFNTHFCVCNEDQLLGSASTLASEIAARADTSLPVILTGDLNVFDNTENSKAIRHLKGELGSPIALIDSFRVAEPSEFAGTFGDAKIDYIMVSKEFQVESSSIDRSIPEGKGSDHHPVIADLTL